MAKSVKGFDKFIRDKVSDVEFSGEKDSWELLNYQLKERAKTKQRKRLTGLLSLLFVVSGTVFFLTPFNEKESKVKITEPAITTDVQSQPRVNSSENNEIKKDYPKNYKSENISLPEKQIEEVSTSYSVPEPVKAPGLVTRDDANVTAPAEEKGNVSDELKQNYSEEALSLAINSGPWENNKFKIEITNVGREVNSGYSDFAPVLSADGATMFFTSRRPVSEKELKQNRQAMEHVYSSSLNSKKNKWANTFILPGTINQEGRNNSVIGFSADGQRMLLYRDDIYGNGDIYESVLNGTEWSAPEILPEPVNTKHHESSATFSPDGKTLYFVSDRPGGTGGRDIWYCTMDAKGKWSNATNIGTPVNSKSDEEGIFIHPGGSAIYFSSKRHDGFGGYDVYRTLLQADKSWSIPENLGQPLNTHRDDVYFVMEPNGTVGYYASTRPDSNGEKDIYKVTFVWVKDKTVSPDRLKNRD